MWLAWEGRRKTGTWRSAAASPAPARRGPNQNQPIGARHLPTFTVFKEMVHQSGFPFSNFLNLSSSGSDLEHEFLGLPGNCQGLEFSRRELERWLHYVCKPLSLSKPQSPPPYPQL